jgi:hypothetical protein
LIKNRTINFTKCILISAQHLVVDIVDVIMNSKNPKNHYCLFLQLLRPNRLRVDYLKYASILQVPEDAIFGYMLENLPQIRSVDVSQGVYKSIGLFMRVRPEDIFRVMAVRWQKLCSLRVLPLMDEVILRDEDAHILKVYGGPESSFLKVLCTSLSNLRYIIYIFR